MTLLRLIEVALDFAAIHNRRARRGRDPVVPYEHIAPRTVVEPPPPIAEIVGGARAHILGAIDGAATLTAPLTGRACVYFEAQVQRPDRDGWVTIARERPSTVLVVVDDSGRAMIDAIHVELALDPDHAWPERARRRATGAQRALLDRLGVDERTTPSTRLRYVERALSPGNRVEVTGLARRDVEAAATYRDAPTALIRLEGSPTDPVWISRAW